MSKTVLLVSNLYPPHIIGGAELIAHYQAKELQKARCKVHVFAGEGHVTGVHYAVSSSVYEGVPVDRIYLNSEDFSSGHLNFVHPEVEAAFRKTLQRVRPDVVHMHNIIGLSAGMASIAAREGIPVVITLHDLWGFCLRNTIMLPDNRICRDFSRCAECQPSIHNDRDLNLPIRMRNDYLNLQMQYVSAFISPSQYLASAYVKAGFPQDRLHVLWNGIDVARFARIRKRPRSGKLRFTFIGYMGEHKGLGVLIEALGLIGPEAAFQVNLVGDGHLRPALEKRVLESGLGNRVRFWGKIRHDSIEQIYEQTDVQVMPSIWPENQPVSITEAMATGGAVIASRIGGIPELVQDGHTGLLFEPGNAVQLAEKMLNLIDRPELVDELGANGFARIQEASLERQTRRLLELYDRTAPVMNIQPTRPLIICCGPRFDNRAWRALDDIGIRFGMRKHMFVMHQWIPSDQLANAKALLVLPGASYEEVLSLMRHKVPLVAPADMPQLADLCRAQQCGLYYETGDEAAECLVWLLEHSEDQELLAGNAQRASAGSAVALK